MERSQLATGQKMGRNRGDEGWKKESSTIHQPRTGKVAKKRFISEVMERPEPESVNP